MKKPLRHIEKLDSACFTPLSYTPRSQTPNLVIKDAVDKNLTDEAKLMKEFVSASFSVNQKRRKMLSILKTVNLFGKHFVPILTITELKKFLNLEFNMDQMNVLMTFVKLHCNYKKACSLINIGDRNKGVKNLNKTRSRLKQYLGFIKRYKLLKDGGCLPAQNHQEVFICFLLIYLVLKFL